MLNFQLEWLRHMDWLSRVTGIPLEKLLADPEPPMPEPYPVDIDG